MSIAMPGVTGYATMTRLIENSAVTHARLDKLANQVSTGLVGDSYAGLGTGAAVSLDLRPQLANLQTWQDNVDAATGRMAVAQSALTQIQSIAANFYAQLNNVQSVDTSWIDGVATAARDALEQVADMLNTQGGGSYVFAGQDTANPPIPASGNILSSGFYLQINAAVGGLAVNGAAVTANTTYAVAASNAPGTSPFSATQSQPFGTVQGLLPRVQVGQNQTFTIGLPASANGLIPDTPVGTPTIPARPPTPAGPAVSTGSYMRDVLRALATIGSLSSSQASVTGFDDLVQDTRISLSGAVDAMAQDAGALGNVQSSLTATQTRLADTATALTGQISSAEDVDMAATLSQLSLMQTQMQASYQLIATLNGLSLAKFLPVG